MDCPSCGQKNPADATFCGHCGHALTTELSCPHCGRPNPADLRFCRGCGVRLPGAAASPLSPLLTVPAVLASSFAAGRYQVQGFLGEGSKKRVYLAHDTRLGREVALALFKTAGLDDASRARIQREAQALGRLGDHPHIVTVYDIGEENGQPYFVSQYMEGGSVADLLQRAEHNRLSLERVFAIADQLCQALAHAHQHGILHRDLKPRNVWLTQDGTAKLGDFGLAVSLDRSRFTQEGIIVGTVAYVPPEQLLGQQVDARSDLYSLGAMLYEMVTGRPPFIGDDLVSVIAQHMNTPPVAPSWHNPQVPPVLEALILWLLAKAPEDRPDSAAAVQAALQPIASPAVTLAERVVPKVVNPLDRLARDVFVGREREMDELRVGLEDALLGRGRLLLLVGEPGIGKTRTASEVATYARLRGAQVLIGRCYEGGGAPPFWPWVQIIRSYVRNHDPQTLMREMGAGAADIAQVVSEVREQLPDLPPPLVLEPEQARFRFFDSVTTFLKNAGKAQVLVLILDDLHGADKASLLLQQFLARELGEARLLIIGTYRDVELSRQHPLAEALGELARVPGCQRLMLRGFSERDVARFIESSASLKPPETLLSAIYQETGGNPFFVNELTRLLVTDGRLEHAGEVASSWNFTLPQSVRDVVSRRLSNLSEECNRVLTLAAVIGREFGLEVLERVSDTVGDRLLEVLEEAMAARVITEVPRAVGYYSFSHALIRETLYEELTISRRVRLHRRIGGVLEDLYKAKLEPHPSAGSGQVLAELAYHFFEAAQGGGDLDKVIDYTVRAGDRALVLLAYEEAVNHYERALHTLEFKGPDETRRCALLQALGDTQMKAGGASKARETLQQAAEIAKKLRAPEQLARAALGISRAGLTAGVVDTFLVGLLEEALGALGPGDSALRAEVCTCLATELYYSGSQERRASLSHEAVEMARRSGNPEALAYALHARHLALWGS